MRKLFIILYLVMLLSSYGNSQILYNNLNITSQMYLDTMTQYEAIFGGLGIAGPDITDLSRLITVRYANDLIIYNTGLKNLKGLDSLYTLNGNITLIQKNDSLLNLDGLGNMKYQDYFTHLEIKENPALERLTEFKRLDSIAYFLIENNPKLATLEGLDSLHRVIEFIISNNQIKNLKGLEGIRACNGIGISFEDSLTSIDEVYITHGNSFIQSLGIWGCNKISVVHPHNSSEKGGFFATECSNLSEVDLSGMTGKKIHLGFNYCPKLKELTFLGTDTINRLTIGNNGNLKYINMPNLARLKSFRFNNNPLLKNIHFENIGDISYRPFESFVPFANTITQNDSLYSIRIPNLSYDYNRLSIIENPRLTELYLPNLKQGYSIDISKNGLKKIENLDNLEYVFRDSDQPSSIYIEQGTQPGVDSTDLGSFNALRGLKKCEDLSIISRGAFLSDFDSLQVVRNLTMEVNSLDEVIEFPSLDTCKLLHTFNFEIIPATAEIIFYPSKLRQMFKTYKDVYLPGLLIYHSDSLVSLDNLSSITKLPIQSGIGIGNNPLLDDCSVLCQWHANGNNIFNNPLMRVDSNLTTCFNLQAVEEYCITLPTEEPSKMIKVYPNPVSNIVKIDTGDGLPIEELLLINLQGKVEHHLYNLDSFTQLSLASQPEGMYFLVFRTTSGKWYQEKLLKITQN